MKTAFFGLVVIGLILCSILFGAICFNNWKFLYINSKFSLFNFVTNKGE